MIAGQRRRRMSRGTVAARCAHTQNAVLQYIPPHLCLAPAPHFPQNVQTMWRRPTATGRSRPFSTRRPCAARRSSCSSGGCATAPRCLCLRPRCCHCCLLGAACQTPLSFTNTPTTTRSPSGLRARRRQPRPQRRLGAGGQHQRRRAGRGVARARQGRGARERGAGRRRRGARAHALGAADGAGLMSVWQLLRGCAARVLCVKTRNVASCWRVGARRASQQEEAAGQQQQQRAFRHNTQSCSL